ncbi:MAG: Sulfate permease [Haloplasmataceae bacterium]|nr:Sulfate permease [Haloplasmataceae bacterium]
MIKFKPAILSSFKNYNKEQFNKDIQSGIILSIIALPLSIALAVSSGLDAVQGIYTSIFLGFILALFSGSPVQIGGPTGTFLVLTLVVMNLYGFSGLFYVTIIAGIILILMGLLRLGNVIKFIPYPVMAGFKIGIGIVIFSTQVSDFLGLKEKAPSGFIDKWIYYFSNLNHVNWSSIIIGTITIIIIILWNKKFKKIPGTFIALILTTLAVVYFKIDIATLGSIQPGFKSPFSYIDFNNFTYHSEYLNLGFTLAILCAMEALLSAVVADGMTNSKHDSNMELISEGLANIGAVVFGGLPGVGAIARTATNVKNGGRTPIAAITHCLILTIILLFFTSLLQYIPLATLAGILFIVSYNMSDVRGFIDLFKAPKSDIFILITTTILTLVVDLAFAVEVSIVLACILFMKRMSDETDIDGIEYAADDVDGVKFKETLPEYSPEILIYRINGPFFFGTSEKLMDVINHIDLKHKVLIIRMRHVPVMDVTGMYSLRNIFKKCEKNNIKLILSGVKTQPLKVMKKYNFIDDIGKEYVCKDIYEAIYKANRHVGFENNINLIEKKII